MVQSRSRIIKLRFKDPSFDLKLERDVDFVPGRGAVGTPVVRSPEGVGEVVDFMPIQDVSRGKKVHQIGCNQPGCITSGMSFDGWPTTRPAERPAAPAC